MKIYISFLKINLKKGQNKKQNNHTALSKHYIYSFITNIHLILSSDQQQQYYNTFVYIYMKMKYGSRSHDNHR